MIALLIKQTFQILDIFLYSNNHRTIQICTKPKDMILGVILVTSLANSQRRSQSNDLRQVMCLSTSAPNWALCS